MDLNVQNNKKPNSFGLVNSNKWSISNIFRNKKSKNTETSSEEDSKAGFNCTAAVQPETKYKNKNQNQIKIDNKYILRLKNKNKSFDQKTILGTTAINSVDEQYQKIKNRTIFTSQCESSSNEDIISVNSPIQIERYRSDDSFCSGKNEANIRSFTTRRSRTARNERYFKRLNRDDGNMEYGHPIEVHSNLLQRSLNRQQNHDGKLTAFNKSIEKKSQSSNCKLKNSSSLTHLPNQQNSSLNNFYYDSKCLNFDNKRSISYDNQIHFKKEPDFLQRNELKLYTEPPIPPPRNQIRQITTSNLSSECRPISYAFDQNTVPYNYSPINKRCNSDDRIWVSSCFHQSPILNQRALNSELQDNQTVTNKHRRFIKRSERNSQTSKRSFSSELEFQYIADATPRSRKPIATIEKQPLLKNQQMTSPLSSSPVRVTKNGISTTLPIINVSKLLQNIDNKDIKNCQRTRDTKTVNKYCKKKSSEPSFLNSNTYNNGIEKINNIHDACSKTVINRGKDKNPVKNLYDHKIESISKTYCPKNNSVGVSPSPSLTLPLHKPQNLHTAHDKYKEKINNEKIYCNNMESFSTINLSETNISTAEEKKSEIPSKNGTNLEDAINELETIYVSLKMNDDLMQHNNFEKFVKYNDEYNNDDEKTRCSPDIILDDVVYRNLKHSNKIPNHFEKQRPFGTPVGPIAFSFKSDYLHSKINNKKSLPTTPDVFFDDLAVRSLRKDSLTKEQPANPSIFENKKRATRTQSANIYSLIHRNAAKPSGGNLSDYESEHINSKYNSKRKIPDDISPPTNYSITDVDFLKETIENRATLFLPRTSLISDFELNRNMEDALNRIAKDAKESSAQLNRDLLELRKGTHKVKVTASTLSKPKYDTSFVDIGSLPEAVKKYEKFTINQLQKEKFRLHQKGKGLTPSVQVFDEANRKNTINNQTNFEVNKKENNTHVLKTDLTMPSLIKKLDPKLFDKIGIIADRCMHQISELSKLTDHSTDKSNENYNKIFIPENNSNLSKIQNSNSNLSRRHVLVTPHNEECLDTKPIEEEEIDKIMKECEVQARLDLLSMENSNAKTNLEVKEVKTPLCLTNRFKSTSPLINQCLLSNIISITPYVSRSNTELLPITGELKLNSVSSFDTISTASITPNLSNLPLTNDLNSSSSPCNLTPIGNELVSCQSDYNSSDELAMIFGIEKSLTYDSSHKPGSTIRTGNIKDHFEDELIRSTNFNICYILLMLLLLQSNIF